MSARQERGRLGVVERERALATCGLGDLGSPETADESRHLLLGQRSGRRRWRHGLKALANVLRDIRQPELTSSRRLARGQK